MAKWKITPTSVSVHLENESPIFGDNTTIVSLEDESGGAFIFCLRQPHGEAGTVKIDIEEFALIIQAANKLVSGYPKK